jgi:hypothetical protein
MLDAGGDEQDVAGPERLAAIAAAELPASADDDVDLVARMRLLRVGSPRCVETPR